MGCVQGYGESCGLLGFLCWRECSSARTYPGIESWILPLSWSHFSDIPMYNFPSQSVVNLYLYSSAAFRCRSCSFTGYVNPRLSTTKVKLIGRILCVHIPGVLLEGRYP